MSYSRLLPVMRSTLLTVVALASAGCSGGTPEHPWLDLGADSPHEIVEFSGVDAGQIVIAMDPTVSPDEALVLGRLIQSQAPPDATVNARLYDDEATARGWRTAPAQMRVEHLQVVVSINPDTDRSDVRWVRPDSLDASNSSSSGPETGGPMAPGMDTVPESETPPEGGAVAPSDAADPDAG